MVNLLKKIERSLAHLETGLILFLLSAMILLSFGQVLLRNFWGQGIIGVDIFLRQLVLWVGFLGAALAVREGKHITTGILPHMLEPRGKLYAKIASDFFAAVISFFLAIAAWKLVQSEYAGQSTLFDGVPVWLFQTILPYSLGLISARYLMDAILSAISSENPFE
jgi:TRAP-type C4-dicarboxylate transport system permease small subunit